MRHRLKMSVRFLAAIGLVHFAVAYSPIIDGALADVKIKVIDDMGVYFANNAVNRRFVV